MAKHVRVQLHWHCTLARSSSTATASAENRFLDGRNDARPHAAASPHLLILFTLFTADMINSIDKIKAIPSLPERSVVAYKGSKGGPGGAHPGQKVVPFWNSKESEEGERDSGTIY